MVDGAVVAGRAEGAGAGREEDGKDKRFILSTSAWSIHPTRGDSLCILRV